MKYIELTQGKVAIVDDADFERLNQFKWRLSGKKANTNCEYAICGDYDKKRKQKAVLMHRLIIDALPDKEVDHIDGDGLNNQRSNLRLCTHAENIQNQRVQGLNKSSKYKGVSLYRRTGKWTAQIHTCKKKFHLGYFQNEFDAAKAYDYTAKELFGEYANTNF